MNYTIKYFTKLSPNLIKRLKRSFTLKPGYESRIYNLLSCPYDLSGAAIAFSKSNRIIGWSSVENFDFADTTFISNFISKRYRHKGIAKQLINCCVEENKDKKHMLHSWKQDTFIPMNEL